MRGRRETVETLVEGWIKMDGWISCNPGIINKAETEHLKTHRKEVRRTWSMPLLSWSGPPPSTNHRAKSSTAVGVHTTRRYCFCFGLFGFGGRVDDKVLQRQSRARYTGLAAFFPPSPPSFFYFSFLVSNKPGAPIRAINSIKQPNFTIFTCLDALLEDVRVGPHEPHGHDQLVQLVNLCRCV